MYVYLYDNFLRQNKFDATIKAVETRLTDYGIAGKILRLQHYTSVETVITDEIKRGAKTIVIVGNDATFGQVLSHAATCDTIFGFIPVGPDNTIADVLGIPVGIGACDVLSRRRVVPLDIGWMNNRYFISQLHIPPTDIEVQYDERFKVAAKYGKMELVVCNLQPFYWFEKRRSKRPDLIVHPQDGKLEAFLRPMIGKGLFKEVYEEPSIFPFEEMTVIGSKAFPVIADGRQSKETKIKIRLAKGRIRMIVGKERQF